MRVAGYSDYFCDLSDAFLKGANLAGADLREANLTGANLSLVDWIETDGAFVWSLAYLIHPETAWITDPADHRRMDRP